MTEELRPYCFFEVAAAGAGAPCLRACLKYSCTNGSIDTGISSRLISPPLCPCCDARAAYAVWEDDAVTLRRAAYDVEETVRALERLTLEEQIRQRLVEILRTGGRLATCPAAELAAGR